jgi:dephospho-CoA kinase
MPKMILLLSGSVAAGKSTLASLLEQRFGFQVVKTWHLLKAVKPETQQDRESLQLLGEELDKSVRKKRVSCSQESQTNQRTC